MSIAWRKVWRDLWHNKFRTVLVVLSTAVGVFALGLVFGMSGVMRARMTESHQESNAPHIEMYTSLIDQDVIEAVLREPGVAAVEGEVRDGFRWKTLWHYYYNTLIYLPHPLFKEVPLSLVKGKGIGSIGIMKEPSH